MATSGASRDDDTVQKEWSVSEKELLKGLNGGSTTTEKNLFHNYCNRFGLLESEETLRSELQSMHDTGNVRHHHKVPIHARTDLATQKFSLASLLHHNPGGLEEWLILKTNAQTNTEPVKRKNAAELRSQGALNFSNAENSSSIMASEPTTPSHQNMNENPAFNSSGMARERDQMLCHMRLA